MGLRYPARSPLNAPGPRLSRRSILGRKIGRHITVNCTVSWRSKAETVAPSSPRSNRVSVYGRRDGCSGTRAVLSSRCRGHVVGCRVSVHNRRQALRAAAPRMSGANAAMLRVLPVSRDAASVPVSETVQIWVRCHCKGGEGTSRSVLSFCLVSVRHVVDSVRFVSFGFEWCGRRTGLLC